MDLVITEVQITCVVLMLLIAIMLVFILPIFTIEGKVLNNARKLLAVGTFLVALHFAVQYSLFKNLGNVPQMRTAINLLFGFPVSFFVNMSLVYLQRQGSIQIWEWLFVPTLNVVALTIMVPTLVLKASTSTIDNMLLVVAVLYGITLLWVFSKQFTSHLRIVKMLKEEENQPFMLLVKWMRWGMLFLGGVSLGFPFVIFNNDLLSRSLYGILTISAGFLYDFCFIGYALNCCMKTSLPVHPVAVAKELANKTQQAQDQDLRFERMETLAENFVGSEFYLKNGITLKDVAVQMGVSCNMLKMWLRTTKYEKFNNWIVALRVEKAKEVMLLHPDFNSEEIAETCGFCDRQYFQSQFRKHEGVTPSKWVKENQDKMVLPAK